jgi:hypothetical protein
MKNNNNSDKILYSHVFTLLINSLLLHYILQLNKLNDCECVNDWRKDYLFYYTISIILISMIYIINSKHISKNTECFFATLKIITSGIAFYCIFTYMRKLRDTCPCSLSKNSNQYLNEFFNTYTLFICIVALFGVAMMISVGLSKM